MSRSATLKRNCNIVILVMFGFFSAVAWSEGDGGDSPVPNPIPSSAPPIQITNSAAYAAMPTGPLPNGAQPVVGQEPNIPLKQKCEVVTNKLQSLIEDLNHFRLWNRFLDNLNPVQAANANTASRLDFLRKNLLDRDIANFLEEHPKAESSAQDLHRYMTIINDNYCPPQRILDRGVLLTDEDWKKLNAQKGPQPTASFCYEKDGFLKIVRTGDAKRRTAKYLRQNYLDRWLKISPEGSQNVLKYNSKSDCDADAAKLGKACTAVGSGGDWIITL